MAGIFNVISKLFGNKYDKDIKKIRPTLDLIHQEHQKISSLNNDELREQTQILKNKINDFIKSEREEIQNLKNDSNKKSISAKEKELLYQKIDTLENTIVEKIEEILNDIYLLLLQLLRKLHKGFQKILRL